MKFSRSAAAAVACACLVLMGCSSETKKDAGGDKAMGAVKADNALCPFSANPVKADIKTASFQGKNVGFCCNGCAGKWDAMTDAQKTEAWKKAMAAK